MVRLITVVKWNFLSASSNMQKQIQRHEINHQANFSSSFLGDVVVLVLTVT